VRFKSQAELTRWALGAAAGLRLFLDYDGTLVDFSPTPGQLEPHPEVIGLLARLAKRANISPAVISGRRLRDLRALLPVKGLWLGGTYGLELLAPSGETVCRADEGEVRPLLRRIKGDWQALIAGRGGFFLEDKGFTLALHARFAEEAEARAVLAGARQALDLEAMAGRFRVLGGQRFLEVAPLLASKRQAVAYLLDRLPLPGARCLYIGDDDKDEEAFPLVHARGGAAAKVAQPSQAGQPTEADFIFESPRETVRWLEGLVDWQTSRE
jgi:trehalose-phosphatase